MNGSLEQRPSTPIDQAWTDVGDAIRQALREYAQDIGDENLETTLKELAESHDTSFPDPAALEHLEERFPGSAATVMLRFEEIIAEANEQQLAEAKKFSLARIGKALLRGASSIRLAPPTSRSRSKGVGKL